MAEKAIWKVWLKRNLLTQDIKNDFNAEVSTTGDTLRNEDIAARIVAARSELRLETILSILHERDETVRQALLQGTAVQDGVVRMSPRVQGSWTGVNHAFDAAAHKRTIDLTATAETRAALDSVGIEVLGEKNSGAYIGLVTDLSTGNTDNTITSDEDIAVTGDKLKIVPDGEAGLGVFFVDSSGAEHPLTHRLSENTPKKLLFRVPALAAGQYTLKVVTRFSASSYELKENRVITYDSPLTVS